MGSKTSRLIKAATHGELWSVLKEINLGADIDAIDINARTALMNAARKGHLDVVRCLVEHGADIEVRDSVGKTALLIAALETHLDVVRYLVEHGADINANFSHGWAAIICAAQCGHLEVVRCMVDLGADIDVKDNNGWTALIGAAWGGHLGVIRYLVKNGADIDAQGRNGGTALMKAAQQCHLVAMRCLVDIGANIEVQDKNGETAIIKAAHECHLEVVSFLVERGANSAIIDEDGDSILIHLISLGKNEKAILPILKQVLLQGCPPIHSNKNGISAKSIAREKGYHSVMDLIEEYAKKPTHFSLQDWHISRNEVEKGALLSDVGSFGVVYHGKWKRMNIVVKEVRGIASQAEMKMFLREANVWHRSQHKNIVRFYGANDHESPYFLISEFAPNGDLQTYLQNQKIKGRIVVWRKILDIAVGLEFLHSRGIIHGDLKGNNIVVSADGTAKLTDFGLSFFEAGSLTLPPYLNPRWRAPEYVNGSTHRPSSESDVFSLGMCIVEIVTGDRPWAKLLYDQAVKHHLKNKIPMHKPACMSDRDWSLVSRMIAFDRTERIRLIDAIEVIEQFAKVEANTEFYPPLPSNIDGKSAISIARDKGLHSVTDLFEEYAAKPRIPARFANNIVVDVTDWFISPEKVKYAEKPFKIGSFGKVYRAKWEHRDVILKEITINSYVEKETFLREVNNWHKARHPNIVPFYGANHLETPCFMISQFATKGTLKDYLYTEKKRNQSTVWRKLLDVAHGLSFLHGRNIVHGDLKGDNIVVDDGGKAMLTDFGLSFVDTRSSRPPQHNLGAMRWRAPEYATQTVRKPSFESDVYSLGMCIVEAVTGDYPWGSMMDDTVVTCNLRDGIPLKKPREMTDEQWKLVQGMTAFERTARTSLSEVIKQLAEFAELEEAIELSTRLIEVDQSRQNQQDHSSASSEYFQSGSSDSARCSGEKIKWSRSM